MIDNTESYFIVPANTETPVDALGIGGGGGWGWISADIIYMVDYPHGCCGPRNIRYINVRTGQRTVVWGGPIIAYAYDPELKIFAISSPPDTDTLGTYLVDLNANKRKISEDYFWHLEYLGGESFRFIGYNGTNVLAIREDGSMVQITEKPFDHVASSPNNQWFVLNDQQDIFYYLNQSDTGMDLFSESGQYLRAITDQEVTTVLWRPDSEGLFFIAGSLYYVDIPDGLPVLIDSCEPEGCAFPYEKDFVWLP